MRQHTLDYWLEWSDQQHHYLSTIDKSFIRSIVYGTLRWQQRLDWIIDQYASRPIGSMDPIVLTILRMGLFQIRYQDRIPNSAAVNTSVDLAREFKRPWATGFINNILRQATRGDDQLLWPSKQKDPIRAIATEHSFPDWMIDRWIERWGVDDTEKFCGIVNTLPTTTLRVNSAKISRSDLIDRLQDSFKSAKATTYSPDGVSLTESIGPLINHDYFSQGLFQVQDEAAQLVTHLLSPQPGQQVWDTCAGQGTKTGHIAQLMGNKGRILSTDLHKGRLDRLRIEMKRLGFGIVETRVLDIDGGELSPDLPLFDRIIIDAPCSGMGVLQKNPDSKWTTTRTDLKRHHLRQVNMVGTASKFLKPHGLLVYSVCSTEPEETLQVVEDFLRNQSEFAISEPSMEKFSNDFNLKTTANGLYTFPHIHGMDGFFAAAFTRRQNMANG